MVALAGYYRIDFCNLYFVDCLGVGIKKYKIL